jgi:hypothetical protein
MDNKHLEKANELILSLTDYIVKQRKELNEVWQLLEDHKKFLDNEIKRLESEKL